MPRKTGNISGFRVKRERGFQTVAQRRGGRRSGVEGEASWPASVRVFSANAAPCKTAFPRRGQCQTINRPAHKLARILWRCWQERTPYDEARYEAALRQAGSPVVALFDRVELGKSPWKNPAKKT